MIFKVSFNANHSMILRFYTEEVSLISVFNSVIHQAGLKREELIVHRHASLCTIVVGNLKTDGAVLVSEVPKICDKYTKV